MEYIIRERIIPAHSASHYAGGDTIVESDIREGRTVGYTVDDARTFARIAPEPGTMFRSREAAQQWIDDQEARG
jgi:hypothetical protein